MSDSRLYGATLSNDPPTLQEALERAMKKPAPRGAGMLLLLLRPADIERLQDQGYLPKDKS